MPKLNRIESNLNRTCRTHITCCSKFSFANISLANLGHHSNLGPPENSPCYIIFSTTWFLDFVLPAMSKKAAKAKRKENQGIYSIKSPSSTSFEGQIQDEIGCVSHQRPPRATTIWAPTCLCATFIDFQAFRLSSKIFKRESTWSTVSQVGTSWPATWILEDPFASSCVFRCPWTAMDTGHKKTRR